MAQRHIPTDAVVSGQSLVYNGTRFAPGTENANALTTGEEVFGRERAGIATTFSLSVVRFSYFTAKKTETITQLAVHTVAAAVSPTLVRFGIYTVASNGDLALTSAATVNDTSLLIAANTEYTKAFASSFAKVAGTRYAVGGVCVGGTAGTMYAIGGAAGSLARAPRLTASVAGSDLPATVAAGSLSAVATGIQALLLP